MNINNIKNTKFLKKMKIKELEDLSNDIREFIIDNVMGGRFVCLYKCGTIERCFIFYRH